MSIENRIERLAWATDIHLDFVSFNGVAEFCHAVSRAACDALVITGDIGESDSVVAYLETLAARTNIPIYFVLGNHDFYGGRIAGRNEGYRVNLVYLWLSSVELAIERVRARVASGGHNIPEAIIRRRYEAGRKNFVSIYIPLADKWDAYDNSSAHPALVAKGGANVETIIHEQEAWARIIS